MLEVSWVLGREHSPDLACGTVPGGFLEAFLLRASSLLLSDTVWEHLGVLALPPEYLSVLSGDTHVSSTEESIQCLLEAARYGSDPAFDAPSMDRVVRIEDPLRRLLALSHLARVAWLASDARELRGVLAAMPPAPDNVAAEVISGFGHALAASLEAPSERAAPGSESAERLKVLEQHASRLGWAHFVVELAALRAEHAWTQDDAESALRHARRASRMARTEELAQAQYFAALTLARTRRCMGRPHLAAHILRRLHGVAPAVWHARIEWEMMLAAGPASQKRQRIHPSGVAVLEAVRLLQKGDEIGAREVAGRVDVASTPDPMACAALLSLLGFRAPSPSVTAFAEGETHDVPFGLDAFGADSTIICVAGPSEYRRLLACTAPAIGAVKASTRPGRIETAFCVLATGEWVSRAKFFEAVYGFEFDAELHKGSLEVVIHRLRAFVDSHAELERADTQLRLRFISRLVVPDPRCERGTSAALLRVLALPGQHSAKDLAERASIPLRTAQAALKALVEEGAVQVLKSGRRVDYIVEDTTFREPTNVR